jgi:hypothetical protein
MQSICGFSSRKAYKLFMGFKGYSIMYLKYYLLEKHFVNRNDLWLLICNPFGLCCNIHVEYPEEMIPKAHYFASP